MRSLLARARSYWRQLRRPDQLSAEMGEEGRDALGVEPTEALRAD